MYKRSVESTRKIYLQGEKYCSIIICNNNNNIRIVCTTLKNNTYRYEQVNCLQVGSVQITKVTGRQDTMHQQKQNI